MQMLSDDDRNIRDMSPDELNRAWDLWFDLAQATNAADPPYSHGVFAGLSQPAVDGVRGERLDLPNRAVEGLLLRRLAAHHEDLKVALDEASSHWGFEDPVYRFYHQSFKVYHLQEQTLAIVRLLEDLAPERPLHPWFRDIVGAGTEKRFAPADNASWTATTRPILEAFFHARFFLEMAVRYGTLDGPPTPLPSGYAALLYLYQLR